jgi:stalled ribosome rescue protein Dom34
MNNEKVEEYNNRIHAETQLKRRDSYRIKKTRTTQKQPKAAKRQKKRQKTAEETEQDVKQTICNCAKNHIRTNNQSTSEILIMCNDLSKDFMEYLTQKRPEHNPITLDNRKNDTTATHKKAQNSPNEDV